MSQIAEGHLIVYCESMKLAQRSLISEINCQLASAAQSSTLVINSGKTLELQKETLGEAGTQVNHEELVKIYPKAAQRRVPTLADLTQDSKIEHKGRTISKIKSRGKQVSKRKETGAPCARAQGFRGIGVLGL